MAVRETYSNTTSESNIKDAGSWLGNDQVLSIIIGIFVFSFGWATIPLLGAGDYDVEPFGTSCTLDWDNPTTAGKVYLLMTLLVVVLTPAMVMLASYAMLLYKVRQNTLRCRRAAGGRQSSSRSDFQLTAISIAVCVGFMVAWMPYAAVSLYYGLLGGHSPPPYVAIAPVMLAKSSCAYNPVFYVFVTMRYRQEMVKILPRFLARFLEKAAFANKPVISDESRHALQTTAPMTYAPPEGDDGSEEEELASRSGKTNTGHHKVVQYKFSSESNGKAISDVHYVQTHCPNNASLYTSVGIQCTDEHLKELPNTREAGAQTKKDEASSTESCAQPEIQILKKQLENEQTNISNGNIKKKVITTSLCQKNDASNNESASTMPRPSYAKRHLVDATQASGRKYSAIIKRRSSLDGLRRCRSWNSGDGDIFVLSNLNLASERKLNPKEMIGEPLKLVSLRGASAKERGKGAKLVTLILAQHQDDVFTELIV